MGRLVIKKIIIREKDEKIYKEFTPLSLLKKVLSLNSQPSGDVYLYSRLMKVLKGEFLAH